MPKTIIEDPEEARAAAEAEAPLRNSARQESVPLSLEDKAAVDRLAETRGEKASQEFYEKKISLELELDEYDEAYGYILDKYTEAHTKLLNLSNPEKGGNHGTIEGARESSEGKKITMEIRAIEAAQRALKNQDGLNRVEYEKLTGKPYTNKK